MKHPPKLFIFVFSLLILLVTDKKFCKSNEVDPYVDNGGTIIGASGKNYCIVAADTRLSKQYSILSRTTSRVFELQCGQDKPILFAASGCWSDIVGLVNVIESELRTYRITSGESRIPIRMLSYLLARTLYSRRFFPFYSFCCLAGIDEDGIGAIYR